MKSLAILLLLVAFASATFDWAALTCEQLFALVPSSSNCAGWSTYPTTGNTRVNCLSQGVVCYVPAYCGPNLSNDVTNLFFSACSSLTGNIITGGSTGSTTGRP